MLKCASLPPCRSGGEPLDMLVFLNLNLISGWGQESFIRSFL
jgi:hypothetical protein